MTGYQVSLYVHLLALVAAASASSVVHLAEARARRAASVGEARQWHALVGRTSRVFPVAVLTLFATGAYMVGVEGPWSWGTGWVEAGLAGGAFLLVVGAVLGIRGARAGRTLARLDAADVEGARAASHDRVAAALSWVNTGVALAVVFAMATKPALAASLTALVVGAVVGLCVHLARERRAPALPSGAGARPEPAG
jgi:hypothetical protein